MPDWLSKGIVQVFDCNFDPTPAEMLLAIYNRKTPFFKRLSSLVEALHYIFKINNLDWTE